MRVSYTLHCAAPVGLLLLFAVAACVPQTTRRSDDDDGVRFSDIVDSDELAETFLDDLGARLQSEGQPLSRRQREALYPILLQGSDDLRTAFSLADPENTRAGRAAALREVEMARRRLDPRIQALLTPSQFITYDRFLDEQLMARGS